MIRFVAGRIGLLLPTLAGMSILIFLMVRVLPGDVVDVLFAGDVAAATSSKAAIRKALGLSAPLPVQYVDFVAGLATGNLGASLTSGEPVAHIIGRALPITAELAVLATVIATAAGIPLGVVSSVKTNTLFDLAAHIGGLIGLSLPNFWFATLALLVTSVYFHWIPPVTWIPLARDPLRNASQVIIPAMAIAVYLLATVMRMTRTSMLEVLRQDYVRTARAKGVRPSRVIFHHALRNSLIPVVTVVGFQLGGLMGGAAVVEIIFGLPGMGYTLVQGIYTRDYPVIQAAALLLATVFVVLNLIVDLAYAVLDPRIGLA
jgi:peptide/nickel transport system permease protein